MVDFAVALNSYLKNFSTALAFLLLSVFILPFAFLQGFVISSGTVFIDFALFSNSLVDLLLMFFFLFLFLFFYSVFVCLMVFAVRKDLSVVKINYYLREKIDKFAFKYFRFLAIFSLVAVVVSSVLIFVGVPVVLVNLILFVVSIVFMFLPQTIVVDEESLRSSVLSNFDFIRNNLGVFFSLIFLGIVSVFIFLLIEFVLDYFFLVGNYFSLFVFLVFLAPFFEVLKTQVYMRRFDLIKSYESNRR